MSLDRIWVHPRSTLQRVIAHTTPTARLASDHFPVIADIDSRQLA
jgi:endonuclease/exonuclease/phosphatase family metal-dependent hydrolase